MATTDWKQLLEQFRLGVYNDPNPDQFTSMAQGAVDPKYETQMNSVRSQYEQLMNALDRKRERTDYEYGQRASDLKNEHEAQTQATTKAVGQDALRRGLARASWATSRTKEESDALDAALTTALGDLYARQQMELGDLDQQRLTGIRQAQDSVAAIQRSRAAELAGMLEKYRYEEMARQQALALQQQELALKAASSRSSGSRSSGSSKKSASSSSVAKPITQAGKLATQLANAVAKASGYQTAAFAQTGQVNSFNGASTISQLRNSASSQSQTKKTRASGRPSK